MKVLKRNIPVDEIQVGDCMWAVLDVGAGTSQQWRRRCQLVEICGNILRVETSPLQAHESGHQSHYYCLAQKN